jgi:hypothetical protein
MCGFLKIILTRPTGWRWVPAIEIVRISLEIRSFSKPQKPIFMYSKSVVLGTAAWLSLLPSIVSAEAFLYEPFDYFTGSNGTNGGNGGTGWAAPWAPQPSSTETGVDVVAPGGLTYTQTGGELKSKGNVAFIDGPANSTRNITPISASATKMYFSFIGKETNDQALRRYLNVCFFAGDTEKISIGHTTGMATPSWSVSLNTNVAVAETNIPATTQALVVVKVELNVNGTADRASIYINPPLGAEPSSPTAVTELDILGNFSELTRVRLASGGQDESNGVTRPKAEGLVDELRGGLTWADVTATGAAGAQVIPQTANANSATGGVFTFLDSAGGTVDLTRTSAFQLALTQNGTPVTNTLTASKTAGVTSVNFTAALAGGTYDYAITIPVNGISGSTTKTVTGRFSSFTLPTTLAGPAGTVGSWGIREYPTADGAASSIAASLAIIAGGATFVDGSAPVFNHSDPDMNGATSSGNFNNDFPIISDGPGDQNFIVVGKTKVTVPAAGDYTFSVHSDDGFGMRVTGGSFISRSGGATIDPKDSQTMLGDFQGPDSNARAVYHFNAAGTYDITYLGYDSSGGGYYEVAWAFGAFVEDRDTNTWALVGNPSDPSIPAFRPRFAATFPGPLGTAGNFGIRTYYTGTVTGFDQMIDFLKNTPPEPGDATISTTDVQRPYLNANDPENRGNTGFAPNDDAPPGNTGGDDNNVVTSAKGRITVATAGVYTFNIQADDGYLFRLKGVGSTPNPSFKRVVGNGTIQMSNPNEFWAGGDGNLRGVVSLIAGDYDIEFIHYENNGGFSYEVSSAAGDHGNDLPAEGFALVGYVSPGASVAIPKMKSPGWTVEASVPGQTIMDGSVFTAEEAILITSQMTPPPTKFITTVTSLNYEDPESGGGTYPDSKPFPLGVDGTPGGVNDDNFAIRATGTVIITTAGEYHFGFQGDDGGYLTIKGGPSGSPAPFWKAIVSTTSNGVIVDETDHATGTVLGTQNRFQFEGGTGNSRTIASIDLQPGEYTIQGLFMDLTGGAFWEVFASQPFTSPSFSYPLLQFGGASTASIGSSFPIIAPVVVPVSGPFNITNFATTGTPISGATFNFNSGDTGTYAVQVSTDLVNWSTITAPVTVTGSVSSVTASFAGQTVNGQPIVGQPKLFIRVVRTF